MMSIQLNKRWEKYIMNILKHTSSKWILNILACSAATFVAVYLLLALFYGSSVFQEGLFHRQKPRFEESATFQRLFDSSVADAFFNAHVLQRFETSGVYDPNKNITILPAGELRVEEGMLIQLESPLVFRLQDLVDGWNDFHNAHTVVVAQNADGGYVYLTPQEFITQIRENHYQLTETQAGWSVAPEEGLHEWDLQDQADSLHQNIVDYVYDWNHVDGQTRRVISSPNGQQVYLNFWTINLPNQLMQPRGQQSLLELANTNAALNAHLTALTPTLWNAWDQFYWNYQDYLNARDEMNALKETSNFRFAYIDGSTQELISNVSEWKKIGEISSFMAVSKDDPNISYAIIESSRSNFSVISNVYADQNTAEQRFGFMQGSNWDGIFIAYVDMTLPEADVFAMAANDYATYVPFVYYCLYPALFMLLLVVLLIVLLSVYAGRKAGSASVHLTKFDRIWTEISMLLGFGLWILLTFLMYSSFHASARNIMWNNRRVFYESVTQGQWVTVAIYGFLSTALFLLVFVSLVRRIKAKTLWSNSVTYKFGGLFLRNVWKLLKCSWKLLQSLVRHMKNIWLNRKITFRSSVMILGFLLLHWFGIIVRAPFFLFLLLFVDLAAIMFVYANAIAKNRIKTGIKEIAEGNVEYQISRKGLYGENLVLAELVNSVGNGLSHAVDQSLRSERLKTDLITNVSHDIKTPLTSIINYIDLLKRENFTDPKVLNYLDILDVKSQQLKNLTEDVVEASKVSSGNVNLEMMNMNLVELIHQVEGEFEDRFEEKKLTYISHIPHETMLIHVDGKRMWRILENIYSNVNKYTMPGTRVYAEVHQHEQNIVFSLKNVSEKPLNISPEELTERFIRGDVSRSTEGSGLGLSITKSLTELMNGSLEISIDGDLFKVELQFPAC